MVQLIGIQPLIDVIALTLQTAFIENEANSASLLLIAKPETAKTTSIEKFSGLDFVAYFDEITAKKLIDEFFPLVKNNQYKFLLVPDLINCIEKQKATREQFLALIKSGIDDTGVKQISTYHKSLVYQGLATGIKFGMITAITTANFKYVKKEMVNTGLLSRFIPFSYDIPMDKIVKIFALINGKELTDDLVTFPLINKQRTTIKADADLLSQLNMLSRNAGIEDEAYGFRTQINLQRLTKASALIENRNEVIQADIDKIIKLNNWMNLKMNII